MKAINQESLEFACRRIEDFYNVQKDHSERDKALAVNTLLESFGLGEDLKELFIEWIDAFGGKGDEGAVLLGLLVGLFACSHDTW